MALVEALLGRGADPTMVDAHSATPAMYAEGMGLDAVVALLRDAGASVHTRWH